jgi:hypothetical protein
LGAIAPNKSVVCGYSDDGHFMGPLASLVAIGDAMPETYTSVDLTVTIRKNCLYSLWVSVMLYITHNGHIMMGVNFSSEGMKVLGGG